MLVTQMSATKTQLGHYNASNIDISESHQNIDDEQSRQRRYKETNMASMGQLMLLEQTNDPIPRVASNLEFIGQQESEGN